jgi:hypothetical protein
MEIEDLLNTVDEIVVSNKASDKDSCQAVLDAHWAQDEAIINGGDDDVDDDTCIVNTGPTR